MCVEATGDCWKPFYYLLEDLPGVEVMLVSPEQETKMWKLTDEQIEAMTPQERRELIIRPDFVVVTDKAQLEGLSIVPVGGVTH